MRPGCETHVRVSRGAGRGDLRACVVGNPIE